MQCIQDPHLKCLNTYWSRGIETVSCWYENKDFLEILCWFIDNPIPCIPINPDNVQSGRLNDDFIQCIRAEIWGWFSDRLSPNDNNFNIIEPWIKSGALDRNTIILDREIIMTDIICMVMQVAEWRYFDYMFKNGKIKL